jgi:hypothetical protein
VLGGRDFLHDLAADLREEWRKLLVGEPDADARRLTDAIVDRHALAWSGEADDEEIVAWLALALAQYETGRLQPRVRDRALAIIDAGADLELWEDEAAQRKRVLDRLAVKLRGPQPAPKRIRGARPGPQPGVEVGDVVRVFNRPRTRSSLWAVVAMNEEDRDWRLPVLHGLYWDGGAIPGRDEIAALPYLSALDLSSFDGPDPPDHHSLHHRYVVTILARNAGEAFGPEIGEIVARDVRPRAWTPGVPSYNFTSWLRLVLMIDDGEFDVSLRATARRLAT